MAFITVDNKKIYYEEYGHCNFPVIVYFHGGPGESCLSYTHQAKILGKNYHVIIFDQYGVFRSDALESNQSFGVADHAMLIEKMRIALGINSWIVLGHSYGGMLACQYVHMYPSSAEAVIYDCPMWNVLLTSKTIATTTLPFYIKNNFTDEIKICKNILSDSITPNDAFDLAINLDMNNRQLRKFCHIIDDKLYSKYMTEFIPLFDEPEYNLYKYLSHTQKLKEKGDFYYDYLPYLSDIKIPSLLLVGEYDMTCGRDQQEWFSHHSEN